MDRDRLDIGWFSRTDGAELRLSGELTRATATGFTDQLLQLESSVPATLVIDLRGVRFIDSTGLAELIAADKRLRRDGRRLVLVVAPGPVERLFALARLDRHFEIAAESPQALRRRTARRAQTS
jgi:anti-anti-sigma factor